MSCKLPGSLAVERVGWSCTAAQASQSSNTAASANPVRITLLQLNRGMDPLRTTGFERRLRILAYLAEDRQVSRAERRNASAINLLLLPLQFGHSEEFMRLAAPHAANGAVLVGLVALLATAGCSAVNVGARHTGSFVQGRPVISLGTCCVGYQTTSNFAAIYATDKSRKSLWLPVVDKQGLPHPAGHRHDAYYTGDTVRAFHSKRPDGYAYKPIKATDDGRFDVDISRSLPDLRTVNFREFNAFDELEIVDEFELDVKPHASHAKMVFCGGIVGGKK